MNYRQHYFLLNAAGIIGVIIGGLIWFVDASVRMFSAGVAKMPFDSISWRMYVYPMIGGALAWLLVRFPLMARCADCKAKLRFYRLGTPRYVCPQCGATFDPAARMTAASEPQDTAAGIDDVQVVDAPGARAWLARLRQKLYPKPQNGQATWKLALGALCIMALLSTFVPLQGGEVEVMGIQIKNAALAARISWVVWAILNLYLLIGIGWSLIDPEDQPTAALSRGWRGLFMALGMLFVAISLLVPVFR